eukprot:m.105516 g.105516  ORF g.105516 m.105516 type:complete len:80 (+) comp14196_c0_seq9:120-359(+)
MPGYCEKSDVWKLPFVLEHALGSARRQRASEFRLFNTFTSNTDTHPQPPPPTLTHSHSSPKYDGAAPERTRWSGPDCTS